VASALASSSTGADGATTGAGQHDGLAVLRSEGLGVAWWQHDFPGSDGFATVMHAIVLRVPAAASRQ
jgi:hypothetical protein